MASAGPQLPHHEFEQEVRKAAIAGKHDIELAVFTPREGHDSTVFLLHGLGDTAYGWTDAVVGFYARALPRCRFVLPTAPTVPVTLNMGMHMPSWYDLRGLGDRDAESCDGIEDTRAFLAALVDEEIARGIPASRIVLAGFSQGGACSLYTGLQLGVTLGGILCKSGYLPCAGAVAEAVTDAAKRTPVLMLHGDDDPMVLPSWAEKSRAAIEAMGVESLGFKMYRGLQHSASIDELVDATAWLVERVGDGGAGDGDDDAGGGAGGAKSAL
uniref:Phospholipase/carboxylesterase/thioesterase domain-containing protein n=1 Tax=Bicosoecida sp. CB-2014 TaxID=1486930 RepID=A0A7S1C823_9STRA